MFQTETVEPEDTNEEQVDDHELPSIPEDGEIGNVDDFDNDDNEQDNSQNDAGEGEALDDPATVLTVTARKWANMTQGRKFSGQPRPTVAERKKRSVCAACGERGHWANDPECSLTQSTSSSSSTPKGKSKGQKGRDDRGSGDAAKKVMTVHHSSGFDSTVEYLPPDASPQVHFAVVCSLPFTCLSTTSTEAFGHTV